jgi:hypothetical protein
MKAEIILVPIAGQLWPSCTPPTKPSVELAVRALQQHCGNVQDSSMEQIKHLFGAGYDALNVVHSPLYMNSFSRALCRACGISLTMQAQLEMFGLAADNMDAAVSFAPVAA